MDYEQKALISRGIEIKPVGSWVPLSDLKSGQTQLYQTVDVGDGRDMREVNKDYRAYNS
jgi:hypothetical protein